jgi:hypothetical protein
MRDHSSSMKAWAHHTITQQDESSGYERANKWLHVAKRRYEVFGGLGLALIVLGTAAQIGAIFLS